MQENLWLLANHIDDHKDHLFFLVRDLLETKCGKVQLVIHLEYIFESWQSVYDVPVIHLRMLINLHARRAACLLYTSPSPRD